MIVSEAHRLTHLTRAYAALGSAFRPSAEPPTEASQPTPGCPALTPDLRTGMAEFVAAYRLLEDFWKTEFEEVVVRSEKRLGGEPLLLPTIANLIPVDHENAVSKVLAEVLKLLPKTAAFGVFGLRPKRPGDAVPSVVERERPVAEGHAGQRGRLDLAVRNPDQEWLVIEIKLGSADGADLAKNEGYVRSLDGSRIDYQAVVLIKGSPTSDHGHGFEPVDWRETLLRLGGPWPIFGQALCTHSMGCCFWRWWASWSAVCWGST